MMLERDANLPIEKVKFFYSEICDNWKRFCEYHLELLELTQDEFHLLVNSQLEEVSQVTELKSHIIASIDLIEQSRQESQNALGIESQKFSELISFFESFEIETSSLKKFNSLLIDLVQEIQEQNKQNRYFLNRALASITEIRNEYLGLAKHQTYDASGNSNR